MLECVRSKEKEKTYLANLEVTLLGQTRRQSWQSAPFFNLVYILAAHRAMWGNTCVIRCYFYSYFWSIFNPTFTHTPYPIFLHHAYFVMFIFLCHITLTNRQQEHNSIGTTSNQTTHLLGYQHSKTVLLWFLLDPVLCWSLLRHYQMLPPLKVPDFPDTEHK